MKVTFSTIEALDNYSDWPFLDKKIAKKIVQLIHDIAREPYDGLGKPEALKENLTGYYSRRITDEHRLIYRIDGDTIVIISCKGHYGDK
jgi:toxin YoeB